MHRGRTRMMALAAVASLLVVAAGCGNATDKMARKASEKMIEHAADGDVDVQIGKDGNVVVQGEDGNFSMSGEDGTFKMENEDGSFSSEAGKVPASWPDDVPLPSPFEVQAGSEMMDAGGETYSTVGGTTSISVDELKTFYAEALSEWEEVTNSTSSVDGRSHVQSAYETTNRTVTIMITEVDGPTQLNISHTLDTDG
ncbi:MAG: hypothetical protein ABI239_03925 [Aquihabitans sp.]